MHRIFSTLRESLNHAQRRNKKHNVFECCQTFQNVCNISISPFDPKQRVTAVRYQIEQMKVYRLRVRWRYVLSRLISCRWYASAHALGDVAAEALGPKAVRPACVNTPWSTAPLSPRDPFNGLQVRLGIRR